MPMPQQSTEGDMKLNKRQREESTANRFLSLFNERNGTQYEIKQMRDAPDVHCTDKRSGATLFLEVTLLEGMSGFIESANTGKPLRVSPHTGTTAVSLLDDVVPNIAERINDKLLSSYGANTALVLDSVTILFGVREWELIKQRYIPTLFAGKERNFGAGVWIVFTDSSLQPTRETLFCLHEPTDGVILQAA